MVLQIIIDSTCTVSINGNTYIPKVFRIINNSVLYFYGKNITTYNPNEKECYVEFHATMWSIANYSNISTNKFFETYS